MLLELISERPDWLNALSVALTLPPGMAERRAGQDPWQVETHRPRRVSDDLAWLRQAFDEPEEHGLRPLDASAAVAAWAVADDHDALERCARLRARGVLDAAGFLVHEDDEELG